MELGESVPVRVRDLQEQFGAQVSQRDPDLGVRDPAVRHGVRDEFVRQEGYRVGQFVGDAPVREGFAGSLAAMERGPGCP